MSKLSPSEKKGILVLSGIVLLSFIVQALQPYYIQEDLYDYSVQDSIFKSINIDSIDIQQTDKATFSKRPPKTKREKALSLKSININNASLEDLVMLPRIGPSTARNILEYRKTHGNFKNIKEIEKVKRIGPKTFELIKPYIIVK